MCCLSAISLPTMKVYLLMFCCLLKYARAEYSASSKVIFCLGSRHVPVGLARTLSQYRPY